MAQAEMLQKKSQHWKSLFAKMNWAILVSSRYMEIDFKNLALILKITFSLFPFLSLLLLFFLLILCIKMQPA